MKSSRMMLQSWEYSSGGKYLGLTPPPLPSTHIKIGLVLYGSVPHWEISMEEVGTGWFRGSLTIQTKLAGKLQIFRSNFISKSKRGLKRQFSY